MRQVRAFAHTFGEAASGGFPRQFPPLAVTPAVETVEKVTFQKIFLKSGTETLKSVWFLAFRTTFWQFLSLLWGIFLNIFRTRGFSTVSLGGYHKDGKETVIMTKRLEIGIATMGILVALFVLLFGDNIYQQITGHTLFEKNRISFANETPADLGSPTMNEPSETSIAPTSAPANQEPNKNWILGEILYEEDFEDGLIDGLETKFGSFDIVETSDGNHVWRTSTGSLSQLSLPTTSNDYAFEVRIMHVSGEKGLGFVEVRKEPGKPCDAGYAINLDVYGDWLNLLEREQTCEELRDSGLFANTKITLSNGIWYTIRVEAKGAEVRVYFNDKLILRDTDIDGTIRKSSTVDIATCCGDLEPFVFDFDDIKAWLLVP